MVAKLARGGPVKEGMMLLLLAAALAAQTEKPNLIVINIDDLGYADIGPFGSTLNRTPHLDRMAREGRKLTCFYAAPVCSPSRSALLTGCHPKRVLPIPHVLFPADPSGLHPGEITVAELLKARGYATGMVGKWHLGDQPEFLPTRQGFDAWFGLPYSNDMGPAADGVKSDFGAPIPKQNGKGQPPLPLLRGEKVLMRVKAIDQAALTARYTQEALKFIRAKKDGPFFLYLAHNSVHFPLYPGDAFRGKSGNGLYGDWVEETDASVGAVLDAVRELGLEKKTFVLFTSDNGGTKRGSNAPLRGHKASTWEGGVRVPTIAWWPGAIPAGTETAEVCGMIDVLPTLATLAGAETPRDRTIDGRDLGPLLLGREGAKGHETWPYWRGLKLEAVRKGPYKLHLAKGELYDLAADPGESKDLSKDRPDVAASLRALTAMVDADLGLDGRGPGVRTLGKVEKPLPLIDHDGKVREGFEP
jgi:arylsulfatase A